MQGVVPAAGEGTRLRPLTADRPKGLVTVAGRPLLAYALKTLVGLGVDELLIVVGDGGDQIRARFGASFDGVPVQYAEQPEPMGLADAVLTAEPAVDGDFVVLNGDNVVDADLSSVIERHREVAADATLVVDNVSRERATQGGVVTFEDDGRPSGVVEKPADPPSTWVTRGCYAFSPRVFDACRQIQPSETGEYELSAAVDRLIRSGATVVSVPFEGRCVNVNTPDDLEAAERLVRD